MAIIASDSGSTFTPAPEGLWLGVCCDVVDLGMVETAWGTKHKVRLVWQLEMDAGRTEDDKPLMAFARFNLTLHEHGTLRPFLESWRGRRFTAEELKRFDLEKLLNACCQLQILHVEKDGRTYANVHNIMPYPKGTEKLTVIGYTRVIDRDEQPPTEPEETEF